MSFYKKNSTIGEILQHIRSVIVDDKDFEVLELKDPIENIKEVSSNNFEKKINQNYEEELCGSLKKENQILDKENVQNTTLLTNEKSVISDNAIKSLLKTIESTKEKNKVQKSMTIEQLVIKSVSPLLSRWLNDHLDIIVKKLVEKEIQKITINNL